MGNISSTNDGELSVRPDSPTGNRVKKYIYIFFSWSLNGLVVIESDEKHSDNGANRARARLERSCTARRNSVESESDSLVDDQQKYPPQHDPSADEGMKEAVPSLIPIQQFRFFF